MTNQTDALATATEEQVKMLAAFDSGRWSIKRVVSGMWSFSDLDDPRSRADASPDDRFWDGTEEDQPAAIVAGLALHRLDWINTAGELTALGRQAYERGLEEVRQAQSLRQAEELVREWNSPDSPEGTP